MTQHDYRQIATAWRQDNAATNPAYLDRGVVLIWEGDVYGWKNMLRDALHERPGAIAVDKSGHVFRAEGGDDYAGARAWVVAD